MLSYQFKYSVHGVKHDAINIPEYGLRVYHFSNLELEKYKCTRRNNPPPLQPPPPLQKNTTRMPNVSDRGLRYVLHGLAKGSRVAAASYLADCCTGGGAARSSTSLEGLEVKAEAFEHRKLENARKAEEVSKIKQEAKMRDKEERDALKGKIVARYADEVSYNSMKHTSLDFKPPQACVLFSFFD